MLRLFMKLTDSLQKIGKMKDSITIGLLGGLMGAIFMDISNLLIFKAGKTETLYGHIAGGLFVAPFRTKQRKNFILGEITHLAIGSIWGIPLTYILRKTGKDHHLLKGALISALSLGSLIGGQKFGVLKKFGLTKTFYSAIWNHLVYGLVSAQAITLLADPTIFASPKETNNEPYRQVKSAASYPYSFRYSNEFDQSQPHHAGH
ncbi:hypothetical protein [Desulfosporosinus sp. Sb-LF]|uniref:hypothetical protein n=1 Tax=Desulfosporosinus sp. Sb-LF TaxID=2560027 RepID=UPI00107F1044|nr:hypothetical protein [Desulfosporosinus sp. Sb-LF]TGE33705.1 hypothetical protein E4K68_06105 [Desulfosporosinus sp. Sb-LF]